MPLALWDVDDAAGFVWAIVNRSGLRLDFHDAEELHQFLLIQAWELSLSFEDYNPSFSAYATLVLRRRIIDWQRRRNGRTVWKFKDHVYERKRPEFVSLDADDSVRDQLEHTLGSRAGDPASDCGSALAGLYEDRDRQRARDLDLLGLDAA